MEDDQALEWENKEHEEIGGNMSWIMNKGLAMGKKVLITGAVISSAPVILPSLLIISTLGLVCAAPYCFFLATYGFTKKLIATLLPTPKASAVTFEDLRAKDSYEEYGGDVDMANEEEELRRRVDMRLDEKENYKGGVKDKDENASEGENENVSNVKEEVTVDENDVAVESIEKERDGGEEKREENLETDRNVNQTVAQSGNGDEGKADEAEASDVKKDQETATQSGNGKGVNPKETKANRVKKNRKVKNVDARETADASRPDSATPEGHKKPGLKDIGGLATKEALYSEEKIWKQIDAMRAVVGYTTTRQTTCIDELKALYVFTGVQPPLSFKDPADLQEVHDKLRFLMSVVGVK